MYIAWNPNDTILNLVGNAWAGFGAAFGPIVLLSLYWKRLTKYGAIAGILTGSLVVIFWILMKDHGGIFEFYEIIPGFISCMIVTVIVSLMTKPPVEYDLKKFDDMEQILKS